MKSIITDYISEDKRFQELDDVFGQENILVTGLSPSAKATIIAEKYLKDQKQLLLVTNNSVSYTHLTLPTNREV